MLGGVLLSRTLAGAVPSALSGLASGFGMDTGRFPVAVTTETTVRAVLRCLVRYVVVRVWSPCQPVTRAVLVCGWWCGLGVDRIVDARVYRVADPPVLPRTLSVCGVWLGVLLFVLAY